MFLPALALAADPQIASFIDAPDPVPAGGLYSYTLRVDNNAVDAATGTRLAVEVPAGATYVQASPAAANCAPVSATRIECSLGTIGALGTDVREVVLTWRALGPGPATIQATATLTASNDSNAANNTQGAVTTVISGANLRMSKTGSPDPVVGGSIISYTLTAANAGPNDAGSIVVTDNLPPAVSFISAAGSGWSCSHNSGVVTCNLAGPLPLANPIPTINVVGRVNASGGTITNSASVAPAATGGVADPDSSDNTATVNTSVVVGANIGIAQKTISSPLPAVAGANTTFVIAPRNSGPAAAVNAVVTDVLPAGWTFVSASGPNWSCTNAGLTVTCTRANFPAGATNDITIVATAPAAGAIAPGGTNFTNSASINSDTADPDPNNNTGSVGFTVLRDGADLRISKTKTPNPVAQGFNLSSTIVVTNSGPRAATGPLRVVELLSGETYVAPFPGGGWTCDDTAAPVLVCTHPNAGGLPVAASLPALVIVTRADVNGNASNTACTGSSVPPTVNAALASPPTEGDANGTNDCATATSRSTSVQPDLAISKQTSTPTGADTTVSNTESSVTYTLLVSNVSAAQQAATGVVITDDIPAYIVGRTTYGAITAVPSGGSSARFSCATSNARVTCTQTAGSLLRNETVTVTIPVNRPMLQGSFFNTASVTNLNEGDPVPGNNQASSPVTIAPIADIEMTAKSVTPTSIRAGEQATYVLSYRNNGPSPAANVVLRDTFTFPANDSGLTVEEISSNKPLSTCSIVAGAKLTPAQNFFTCSMGTLESGDTFSVTLRVRPNYQAPNVQRVFTNLVRVDTDTRESPSGGDNGNNTQNAQLNITAAAVDLLINKTDRVGATNLDPVPFNGSAFLGYELSVTNNGPSFATGVNVAEAMTPPANRRIRFVCDVTTFGGSTCNTPTLCTPAAIGSQSGSGAPLPGFSCTVPAGTLGTGEARGELAVGASKKIWLRFEAIDPPAPTGDVFNNVATVSANEPDIQSGNNIASEPTTTRQRIRLSAVKTSSNANPALLQPFNWIVTVANAGPANSLQTDLSDTLPAEAEVTGAITWSKTSPAATGTCSRVGVVVSCALGQLNAGGSVVVTVPVRITRYPVSGSVTNTATVDTDPTKTGAVDLPGGENVGSSTLPVQAPASLAGTVFEDRDRSGSNGGTPQLPAAEPRVAGVTITLTGVDGNGNTINRSTTTDASGNYSFTDLPASNGAGYTVTQTQPFGYANGPVNPPNSGGLAPSVGGSTYAAGGVSGNSSYTGIVLVSGVDGVRFNFPELRRATLGGFVYVDTERDGARDPSNDPPIANATVRLFNAATNTLVATTLTAADGSYLFVNLDPTVRYTLEEPLPSVPPTLGNGLANAGTIAGVPCAAGCTVQPNVPAVDTDRIANIDLETGFDGRGFDFGEFMRAGSTLPVEISGTVYIDRVRNGTMDPEPSDGRIPGVTVRLVEGDDCSSGLVRQTTTTDSAGNYRFTGVAPRRDYLICEVQPAGYATAADNPGSAAVAAGSNAIRIVNLPFTGSTGNNFGERLGSLSGSVWLDLNNDGTRQAASGEVGIPGVTITLSGTDAAGQTVTRTTVTNGNGDYRFDDLPAAGPAGYTVTEQTPQPVVNGVTTINGKTVAGSTGGVAGGVTTLPSAISGIALAAGADSTDNRFGELPPVSISGLVFLDLNNNGVQNLPGDLGLAGVSIVLSGIDDNGATVTRTTTTAADGIYAFNDLRPGSYTVTEPGQPAGTGNGLTVPGNTGGTATPVTTTPSSISGIVLTAPGSASVANNFAEIRGRSALEGRVWVDGNNNGVIDGSEVGIAGVRIELSGTDSTGSPITRSTQTDANGRYRFEDLPAGTYAVLEPAQPPSTINGLTVPGSTGGIATAPITLPSSLTGIVLPADTTSSANNFGELPQGLISGLVYIDSDNNGTPAPGENGIAGVTVVLTGTDDLGQPVRVTQTTGADGRYSFDGLRPGSYTVTEPAQPAGTSNGITTPGSLGGNATPTGTVPSAITPIVLPLAGQSINNNFGEQQSSPDVRASKSLVESALTVGFQGHYRITMRNIGDLPTVGSYTVSDRLPAGVTLAATPVGTGWTCSGAAGAGSFSCSSVVVIAPGGSSSVITATVNVAASAAGTPASNAVIGEGGGEIDGRTPSATERDTFNNNPTRLPLCGATADQNTCRTSSAVQLPATLSGTVWLDVGGNTRLLDPRDTRLPGWLVEVVDPATGQIVGTATTGSDGSYQVKGLLPGIPLVVRFRDPTSGIVFGYPVNGETAPGSSGTGCDPAAGAAGKASSCVGNGAQPWLTVILAPGQDLPQQSLPVDPGGIVYDSGTRTPLSGAVVTLSASGSCAGWNPQTAIVGAALGGYSVNGNQVSMTTGINGYYQFLFGPAAPSSCTFGVSVTPPAGYTFVSTAIPPASGPLLPTGAGGTSYPVQPQAGAPTAAVGAGTTYYLVITAGSAVANVVHNHIPLDPALPTAVSLSKTGDKSVVEVGELVRYTITVNATAGALPRQTTVVDRLPAGFTFVTGSATVDGRRIANPAGGLGPTLAFNLGAMPASRQLVLQYRVRVGVGAAQGDGVNRASALLCGVPEGCVDATLKGRAGSLPTNEGAHRVRIAGGVFATEACVVGKVFVDCNGNHLQDREELGIPGVRLVMQDGTTLISDSEGKYSLCGLPPRSAVLKVDALTLPRGSRLTTSSSRNLGDAGSLWLDLKNGELARADFIEGSCSNTVLEQVKARRAQGEVRAPETERKGGPALRFDSKAHGLDTQTSPRQGTDGANQRAPKPRAPQPAPRGPSADESVVPTPSLPMNRPPPVGRDPSTAADAEGSHGTR